MGTQSSSAYANPAQDRRDLTVTFDASNKTFTFSGDIVNNAIFVSSKAVTTISLSLKTKNGGTQQASFQSPVFIWYQVSQSGLSRLASPPSFVSPANGNSFGSGQQAGFVDNQGTGAFGFAVVVNYAGVTYTSQDPTVIDRDSSGSGSN